MSKSTEQGVVSRAALAVSILALIIATVGVAVARPAKNQLGSRAIKQNSLKSIDLRDGRGVKGKDVKDESLTGTDVRPDSLTAADFAPGSVGSIEILANAVGSEEIAGNAVGSEEIPNDAVGSSEIAPNGVNAVDLAPDAVGTAQLADGSVQSSDIGDGQILAGDLGELRIRTRQHDIPAGSSGGAFVNCPDGEIRISGGVVVPAGSDRGVQSSWPNGANGWSNIVRNDTASQIGVTAYALCLSG